MRPTRARSIEAPSRRCPAFNSRRRSRAGSSRPAGPRTSTPTANTITFTGNGFFSQTGGGSHGDWHDLCRGPHFRTTAETGDAFKLTKISGAYWRGDENRQMLQRIYATAFFNKEDLEAHLHRLEEPRAREGHECDRLLPFGRGRRRG